eukprot:jgi/Mesen1/9332/ME000061S08775
MGPGPAAHMSCQEQDMKTESGKRSRGQVEKRAQKKAKAAVVISAKSDEGSDALSEPTANLLIVKVSSNRPRRATSDVSYKEPSLKIGGKEARMAVKSDKVAECEDVAVVSTAKGMDLEKPQRRLLDFVVHDEDGKPCSIEALHEESLYFTAVVLPGDGPAERSKVTLLPHCKCDVPEFATDTGWYCETVGPLTSWDISGYEPGSSPAKLWIDTELASYHCVRAASSYKKVFGLMQEKADMCVEVFRALSKPDGGNPDLTLSELVARVSRAFSKGGRLQGKRIRDVLLMHGAFVSEQLRELDNSAEEKDQIFNGLPSLSALELESASHSAGLSQSKGLTTSGAIIIKEPSAAAGSSGSGKSGPAAKESSDAAFAQQLAQEEDVKAAGRQSSQRGAGAKAKVYVKINEDEIADDYPPPAYYKAEEEEMDEYELFDDDMNDMAPEDLPRRRLEDWTLYNSDARLVPLEIVPMLSNVETDMDVFGSGVMTEDDGSGFCLEEEEDEGRLDGDGRQRVGTAEAGGSSGGSGASSSSAAEAEGSDSPAAGADAAAAGGIRIYLSAVKEWMIEFGASMVFISFRTDIAWYRLGKPAQQYLPWYKPVLTSAKLAISVITMLKAETRVSRLSFNDVIARLADEKRADKVKPASRKEVEAVERYVVVHSQIVLQQFREYPDKLVRQSAFAARLAEKMTERRHTKLKISARKKILARSVRNSNPRASMRPDATKARPMRATTTKLVQKIWKAYYEREAALAGDGERAEEEGGKEGKGMDGGGGEEELQDNDSDDEEPEAAEEKASPISDSGAVDTVMADDSKNRQVYGIDAPVKWVGKPRAAKGMAGHVYQEATIGQVSLRAGDVVAVHAGDEDEEEEEGGAKGGGGPGVLLLVEYLCKKERGEGALHGWVMKRGSETVLGNAADERELFLTHACLEVPLRCARSLPAHIQLALAPPSQLAGGADKGKGKAKGKAKAVEAHPAPATAASKGKGKVVEEDTSPKKSGPEAALAGGTAGGDRKGAAKLATLDIFAGCGGLSEGLQQSGVSETKWAIEYEQPAAQAFQLNHPEADVFCDNCNVILRCMMEKGGAMRDCVSTTEADEAAAKMAPEKLGKLPMPGQVDFINGGPPCQVRFGVLQAGNYGVAQSRKRAFIWAAAPGERLPDWPRPRHVFASSQINITLPGGKQYSAVPDTAHGAPYRSITVRDTIGDLPPVANGANREEMERHIRGTERVLVDHVAKEMNELNLMRCQHIPKRPGADWRELPPIQVMLSDGKKADLIPWCLPNTAQRHNQWKGLFGRLDWHGNFPTSVTDPQPMGKVGMCFHPDQDRIVTVRECARSQGFPDHFRFAGTIQAKHRQIGNAVPPPLARALGTMLKAAICSPHAESI